MRLEHFLLKLGFLDTHLLHTKKKEVKPLDPIWVKVGSNFISILKGKESLLDRSVKTISRKFADKPVLNSEVYA
jgi:hypothetical protein